MTLKEAKRILDDVEYLEGTSISIDYTTAAPEIVLRCLKLVKDVYSDQTLLLQHPYTINERVLDSWTESDLLDFVYRGLVWLETHEVQEHFKYKGKSWVDPHPKKKSA